MAVSSAFASGSRLVRLNLLRVLIASEASSPFSIPLPLYPRAAACQSCASISATMVSMTVA
eukprot:2276167-Pyramimonas_sp.AAC.1